MARRRRIETHEKIGTTTSLWLMSIPWRKLCRGLYVECSRLTTVLGRGYSNPGYLQSVHNLGDVITERNRWNEIRRERIITGRRNLQSSYWWRIQRISGKRRTYNKESAGVFLSHLGGDPLIFQLIQNKDYRVCFIHGVPTSWDADFETHSIDWLNKISSTSRCFFQSQFLKYYALRSIMVSVN